MANHYRLIIEDDDGETTLVPFEQGDITVGRWDGNSVRLLDRNVSRRHARFTRSNGTVFLEDLNSFNGIKLNGDRIDRRTEINEGDLVEIGDYHLALQQEKLATPTDFVADERVPTVMEQVPLAVTQTDLGVNESLSQEARPTAPVQQGGNQDAEHPFVSPPPTESRKSNPVLPPFPASGGLSAPENPFFDPQSSSTIADEHSSRTEQISVGPAQVADMPRIVCVSTEYAGQAYALHNAEVIIGRVEDNDVVIEHRSVSRNHAKILFDGQVHKIIDLDSANGILVNGEEYAITDLRHGDLIELGHVNFRFIPAGEAFVPTEEEAKAMLDAGVSPPSAVPQIEALDEEDAIASTIPPQVKLPITPLPTPTQDLSDAKTVTDTPLNALAVSEMFEPNVSPQPGPVDPERDSLWRDKTQPAMQTSASSERRSQRNLPTATEQASLVTDDVDDDYYTGKSKALPIVLVLLVLAALGMGIHYFSGPSVDHDAALAKLFSDGEYSAVESYFVQHQGEFDDAKQALQLTFDAKQKQQAPKSAPKKTPKPAVVEAPEPVQELAEEPTPPVEEPVVEPEEKSKPVVAAKPVEKKVSSKRSTRRRSKQNKRRRRAEKIASNREKAEIYYKRGNELLAFDRKNAEHWLVLCIKTAPYADCHRSLGILFAESNPDKAIYHYRKYVQLKPKADDAATVREFIRRATADGQ